MADNRYFVFSEVPEGVPHDDFNAWYDEHLPEILAIPGFVAAQRYELRPVDPDADDLKRIQYFALFELEGDPADAMAAMEAMNLSTVDSYVAVKDDPDDAGPALPDWWGKVRFASFTAEPVGEQHVARS
jgi:hypothetical protein